MTAAVTVRVHGDLTFFVGAPDGVFTVPVDRGRSVKDAVESAGVPHPEIDAVLVDGAPAHLGAVVTGGERIDVHPPLPRPMGGDVAPRFACDVHLGRLARRLRLLGFDTWYRTHADDQKLARVSVLQGRILLSRDRRLLMRRIVTAGYCPRSDDPDEQVVEVLWRYGLVDSLRPLSRCVRCNGVLLAVDKFAVADRLPVHTRQVHERFSQCSTCDQVYWPGSHLEHIEAFVTTAQQAARAASTTM